MTLKILVNVGDASTAEDMEKLRKENKVILIDCFHKVLKRARFIPV